MPIGKKKKDVTLHPDTKYQDILYTAKKYSNTEDELPVPTRAGRRRRRNRSKLESLFSSISLFHVGRPKNSSVKSRQKGIPAESLSSSNGRTGKVILPSDGGNRSSRKGGFFKDNFFRTTALACIAVALVSAIAIPTTFAKPTTQITLNDNGRILSASTSARTVGEFLEDNNVELGADDVLEAELSDPISEDQEIIIRRAMPRTVRSNGQEIVVSMLAGTVQEALDKAGVVPGPDDEVYPSADSFISPGMTIDHIIVTTGTRTEEQPIAFENKTQEDSKLAKGKTQIVQEGQEGTLQITYKQLFKNGVLISEDDVSRDVIKEPVDQIMSVGTYVEPEPEPKKETTKKSTSSSSSSSKKSSSSNKGSSSSGSSSSGNSDPDLGGKTARNMQVTAYCSYCNSGNRTASGTYPRAGVTIACNSLPMGTRVYIPGFGTGIVEDTGGMGGNVIDVYLGDQPNDDACNAWGRKNLTVYILG